MKKRITAALLAGVAVTTIGVVGATDTASAATPRQGAACVRQGVKFLITNHLLVKAARGQVDYAPLDNTGGTGQIRTDLGDSAFLPLSTVIKLHYTNPELFAWCD
jgi:hypothetical protein